MPITKVDIESFEVLLEGSLNSINDFAFKSNNELGHTSQLIASCINPMIHEDGQLVSDLSGIYNDMSYQSMFNDLDDTTNMFTEKMIELRSIFYDKIFPEAQLLYDEIQQEKNKILEQEGAEDFIENTPDFSEFFHTINWTNPLLLGTDKHGIMDYVHTLIGIKNPKASLSTMVRLPKEVKFEADPVYMDDDEYDSLVDDVNTEVCSSEDCNCGMSFVSALFKKDKCRHMQYKFLEAWSSPNICKSSIELNTLVNMFTKVIDVIKKKNLDITNESASALNNNIKNIQKYLFSSMYYLLVVRETHLKDKLILSKDSLNTDVLSSFEKQGYALEDIYKFLKMNYDSSDFPNQGISTDLLIKMADITNTKYSKWRTMQKSNVKNITKNAILKAYTRSLKKYLNKFSINDIPNRYSLNTFVQNKVDFINSSIRKILSDEGNIMDGIYDFIAICNYENTEIPNIVKSLRMELIDMADTVGSMSDEHVNIAMISVMTEFMVSTLSKKFQN